MFNHEDPQVQPLSVLGGECSEILHGDGWAARCELRYGHVGEHSVSRYEPSAVPPQRRACSRPVRISEGQTRYCVLPENHDGLHSTGPGDYIGGRLVEDVVVELYERISAMETKLNSLRSGLGEVEKRMTRLEQTAVHGPDPHDLSAPQALPRLQVRTSDQLDRVTGDVQQLNADAQQRHIDVTAKLDAMWKVLAAMDPSPGHGMAPIIDSLAGPQTDWDEGSPTGPF